MAAPQLQEIVLDEIVSLIEQDIRCEFETYGVIEEVHRVQYRQSSNPAERAAAFVVFQNVFTAVAATVEMFPVIRGEQCISMLAAPGQPYPESRHKYTKTPNQEQNDTNHTMPIADDGAVHPVPGRAITSGHQVDYQHAMHQQPRGEKSQHAIEQQLTYVTAESTSGPAPRAPKLRDIEAPDLLPINIDFSPSRPVLVDNPATNCSGDEPLKSKSFEEEVDVWEFILNDLHRDALSHIFSFCALKDLSKSATVCSDWNRIIFSTNEIWKGICVSNKTRLHRSATREHGQMLIDSAWHETLIAEIEENLKNQSENTKNTTDHESLSQTKLINAHFHGVLGDEVKECSARKALRFVWLSLPSPVAPRKFTLDGFEVFEYDDDDEGEFEMLGYDDGDEEEEEVDEELEDDDDDNDELPIGIPRLRRDVSLIPLE